MARENKTTASSDGMGWLTLMPFPAFNPLNWGALASSHNAALAALHNTRLALDVWRATSDGMRAMMRLQQDELLKMLSDAETPAQRKETAPTESDARASEARDAEAATAMFVQPMIEATRAYGQVGKAFIVAQRDTLRAFARPQESPH